VGVEVICPLYNASKYVENLNNSIKKQKNVKIDKISYVLTRSNDNSEDILNQIGATYNIVEPEDFSHSKTRETIALRSNSDVLVFITQDIDIRADDWLEKLVNPIINGEVEASFSRQLTKYDSIEKYTREKNYPPESYIVTKDDVQELGLRAFFFSDAASAVKTSIFKYLNGYDGKILPTNEDQYIAHKLVMHGYKIKYCADSIVYHSHQFTLRQLYKRYYDTGVFYSMEPYMNNYGTTKTGGGLAKYVLKRAVQDKNLKVLVRFIPDMGVRFIGMKMGKKNGKK